MSNILNNHSNVQLTTRVSVLSLYLIVAYLQRHYNRTPVSEELLGIYNIITAKDDSDNEEVEDIMLVMVAYSNEHVYW